MYGRPAELLTALAGSILGLLIAFEIKVTDEQAAAIIAFVGLLPAAVTGFVELTRRS